jgi:hypothetical protein
MWNDEISTIQPLIFLLSSNTFEASLWQLEGPHQLGEAFLLCYTCPGVDVG